MHQLIPLLQEYGALLVFVAVFVERAGPPLPAFPLIVVATGAAPGQAAFFVFLGTVASAVADIAWYFAGQRYGSRILELLCRVSLSPDSCVSRTQETFTRWGTASLLLSKFIPGLATMAPPLAGVVRQSVGSFLFYDTLGSVIWCGSAVALGYVFRDAVDDVLLALVQFGRVGGIATAVALLLYVAYKWFQRYSLIRSLRMDRITVQELQELIRAGAAPVIIDARPKEIQAALGSIIPGALSVAPHEIVALAQRLSATTEVIVYCACPNEVSAAKIALQLKGLGVRKVRPLSGGVEAWLAAQA